MNEATKKNLQRKSFYVDAVQLYKDKPLFSWIDLNLTEICNRKCIFCPRSDPAKYPNLPLHASESLLDKIADELRELDYKGSVVFAGFGEPMAHKNFALAVEKLNFIHLELVTNGDFLNEKNIKELYQKGLDLICVSMYDGPFQIEKFKTMFAQAGIDEKDYVLRDRWHTEEDEYGLKLTNRAGMVTIGDQEPIKLDKPCYYMHYSMTIDWNGDILLCVQDWNKKVKLGNVYSQSLTDIWFNKMSDKYRKKLGSCNRNIYPCNQCNTDGTLHGFNHVKIWKAIYEDKI